MTEQNSRRSRWRILILPLFCSGASGSTTAPDKTGTVAEADELLEVWAEEDFESLHTQRENLVPVPELTDADVRNHEKLHKESIVNHKKDIARHKENIARMERENQRLREWREMTLAYEYVRRQNATKARMRRLQDDIVTVSWDDLYAAEKMAQRAESIIGDRWETCTDEECDNMLEDLVIAADLSLQAANVALQFIEQQRQLAYWHLQVAMAPDGTTEIHGITMLSDMKKGAVGLVMLAHEDANFAFQGSCCSYTVDEETGEEVVGADPLACYDPESRNCESWLREFQILGLQDMVDKARRFNSNAEIYMQLSSDNRLKSPIVTSCHTYVNFDEYTSVMQVEEKFERNFRVSREMRDEILVYESFFAKF
jgi:hypothetical protein